MSVNTPPKYLLIYFLLITVNLISFSVVSAENSQFEATINQEIFQYTVVQAGDNYNFKFNKNISNENIKLKLGQQVLTSIYKDNSINKIYSDSYIKERARCYVFDSRFHTYSFCFLPNEFSKKSSDRLWGFATQVPNWKWLFTRILLPVVLAFALFFYFSRRKPSS